MPIRDLHIFLSSPGDVSRERQLALEVIDRIQSERAYRDRLKIHTVAWDKPGAGTAMPAHLEPQVAIDKGIRKPSNCDIVIVVFGYRMGTPLSERHSKPDGGRYHSGTEYEYLDAMEAARQKGTPKVYVYRKEGAPDVNAEDPKLNEILNQWTHVKDFFAEFKNPDGSYRSYFKRYETPADFRGLLDEDLRDIIAGYFEDHPAPTITWDIEEKGSPYPGLMHFTREYAPVFFGREAEILEMLDRVWEPKGRFIIVSGNSGTGKSSLVDAGVLPKLEDNGLPVGKSCACVRMVPSQGAQPFDALMRVLHDCAEKAGIDSYRVGQDLLAAPRKFTGEINKIITNGLEEEELVLFLDQMEELFTAHSKKQTEELRTAFLSALFRAVHEVPLRVIATIRGDFLHYLHQYPEMLEVLNNGTGHYALGPLAPYLLDDVIEKPARCAGLTISPSLVNRLIQDAGNAPGSLPYLAFVLERLFLERENNTLGEAKYDEFGCIEGAIGDHVATVEKDIKDKLGAQALERLPDIFQSLLVVNIDGEPTRRRALKAKFAENLQQIVDYLVPKRLLRTEGEAENCTVSVAHEKLFESWQALAGWITDNKDNLLLLRQAELEAAQWLKHGYQPNHLWQDSGRHKRLQDIIARFKEREIPSIVKEFAAPQERLVEVLKNMELITHLDRQKIGDYLAELGDPRDGVGLNPEGLPQFVWCEVPPGEISLEEVEETFNIKEPFYISKYPVTWKQYRSFLEAADGFGNEELWNGLAIREDEPGEQYRKLGNHPADNVSWYDAMAFCFWLSTKLGFEIRLPFEIEWQQAATGGYSTNSYPWGEQWDSDHSNTSDNGLDRTIAVGMYPEGKSRIGAYDMIGNVMEWCLNNYYKPGQVDNSDDNFPSVRGGSGYNSPKISSFRFWSFPFDRKRFLGFRVCCFLPPSSEILDTESRVSDKKGA